MGMRRVEVVEENGFLDGAIKREFGDVFSSLLGDEYIRLGWCKCTETGESGERIAGAQELQVSNITKKDIFRNK